MRALQIILAAAITTLAPSCIMFRSEPKCFVFSDPAGATILLDGVDSGFTTPAALEPGKATITVLKDGFFPDSRAVKGHFSFRFPRHNDGGPDVYALAFPLFWTFNDFVFPFQFNSSQHPRRIFFRLIPEDRPEDRISTSIIKR